MVDQMPRGERPAPVEDDRLDRHVGMLCARLRPYGRTPGGEPGSAPGGESGSAVGGESASAPGGEPDSAPGGEPGSALGGEPGSAPGGAPGGGIFEAGGVPGLAPGGGPVCRPGAAGGDQAGPGSDRAGASQPARDFFTTRMMKITTSPMIPASMSSAPGKAMPAMPPTMLSPNARSLPPGTLVAPGISTLNRPGWLTCMLSTAR